MPSIKGTPITYKSNSTAMEREVSDTDGVFSKRLINNWAELPMTLRRRQKHRPDILSQFTDYSESENEFHCKSYEPKVFNNSQRIVSRSEFLRKFESTESVSSGKDTSADPRKYTRETRKPTPDSPYSRLDEDYRKHYENHDTRLAYRRKCNFTTVKQETMKGFSDDERKTNSPDSLLMKSSESELSSDEYGHTDDSGAFLEQATKTDRGSGSSSFVKFFAAKDGVSKRKKLNSTDQLDLNKNIRQHGKSFAKESFSQQTFEYENIPRIDMSKLEQKSLMSSIVRAGERQLTTIEQLRIEEGCELRNSKNTTALTSSVTERQQQQQPAQPRTTTLKDDTESSIKTNDVIQDFYQERELQVTGRDNNGERKIGKKMETITEENADGSKLSVREILKRFEELRTQNETQIEEKTNDRTLNAIQETLKKLDEKVKSCQVVIIVSFVIVYYCHRVNCPVNDRRSLHKLMLSGMQMYNIRVTLK